MVITVDLLILGGGIGGLMCAYRASLLHPDLSICVLEEGRPLGERSCPLIAKKTSKCVGCNPCAIMNGMAGAGAFSDGKFIISSEYGGWLPHYVGPEKAMEYIRMVDEILLSFGAPGNLYAPSDEIKRACLKYDLHLQQAHIRHLGTDGNLLVMGNLIDCLERAGNVMFLTGEKALDVDFAAKTVKTTKNTIGFGRLVISAGRSGASWVMELCRKNGIAVENNQVDIGVRVELPRIIWEDISRQIYEPKILYRTKQYGDLCRMFCFNSGGEVVVENTGGVLTVNGHANSSEDKKTLNSNFAILSSTNFTQPFGEPVEYARHIARLGNMISGGSVLVQRFGDLVSGKRTDDKRLKQGTVAPTLSAVAGDLSLCLPKRQLDNIIETLYAIDHVAPGTANYDTLLYGVEAKYYSARPQFLSERFDIAPDIYAIGDGSGVTRSLSQAGAMGLLVAEQL